jgi:serine/threonine-protein kinase RsbW
VQERAHVVRTAAGPEALEQVHALLEELWLALPDVAEGARVRFSTAVAELAANIAEHAGATWMEVRVESAPGSVTAELRDDGRPLPPGVLDAGWPPDDAERGRGLALNRAAASSLDHRRETSGNRWTVVVRTD